MAFLTVSGTIRALVAIVALGSLGGSAVAATESSEATHPPAILEADPHGIYGADAELAATIHEALNRFDAAGLAVPPLAIFAHSTNEGCQGHIGLFNQDGSGSRIDLCTPVMGMILHEIAHAWEHHAVSDLTRQEFLNRAGLETWNDVDTDWDDRGIEAAARVIAWGLMDVPITKADRFTEELDLFELLTEIASPRLPAR